MASLPSVTAAAPLIPSDTFQPSKEPTRDDDSEIQPTLCRITHNTALYQFEQYLAKNPRTSRVLAGSATLMLAATEGALIYGAIKLSPRFSEDSLAQLYVTCIYIVLIVVPLAMIPTTQHALNYPCTRPCTCDSVD